MPKIESFTDVDPAILGEDDYIYIRRPNESANKDTRLGFTSFIASLWDSDDFAEARAAVGVVTASGNLDFPSINAANQADLTMTVNGAAVGDGVFLGLPAAPSAGLVFNAFVSALNTVTIRASNISGGSVNQGSMAFRVIVFKSA